MSAKLKNFWPVLLVVAIAIALQLRPHRSGPPPTPTPTPLPTPTPPLPEARLGATGPGSRGLWQAGRVEVGVVCASPEEALAMFYRALAFEAARKRVDWQAQDEHHQRFVAWADDGMGVGSVLEGGALVLFAGEAGEVARRVHGEDLPPDLCQGE